jgi:type IV pilus assembly protein PilA
MKKQQGFTLIELMIVVAIIGVLSAIAIPAYKNYVTKSEVASAMSTMKALITPVEAHIQEKGNIAITDFDVIGTNANANPLGTIDLPDITAASGDATFLFTFGDKSSITGKSLTFTKNTANNFVWTCSHTVTGVVVKGCKGSGETL